MVCHQSKSTFPPLFHHCSNLSLEIRNFSSCVEKYFTRSLRSLVKYFSTLEEKFRISARPCNILYLSQTGALKRAAPRSFHLNSSSTIKALKNVFGRMSWRGLQTTNFPQSDPIQSHRNIRWRMIIDKEIMFVSREIILITSSENIDGSCHEKLNFDRRLWSRSVRHTYIGPTISISDLLGNIILANSPH